MTEKTYQRRPLGVTAIQFTRPYKESASRVGGQLIRNDRGAIVYMVLDWSGKQLTVFPGEWIVAEANDYCAVYPDEAFHRLFEPTPEKSDQ